MYKKIEQDEDGRALNYTKNKYQYQQKWRVGGDTCRNKSGCAEHRYFTDVIFPQ